MGFCNWVLSGEGLFLWRLLAPNRQLLFASVICFSLSKKIESHAFNYNTIQQVFSQVKGRCSTTIIRCSYQNAKLKTAVTVFIYNINLLRERDVCGNNTAFFFFPSCLTLTVVENDSWNEWVFGFCICGTSLLHYGYGSNLFLHIFKISKQYL